MTQRSTRSSFEEFIQDNQGTFAVTFALLLVPILLSVAASVDYSRALTTRQHIQAALDTAVLAGVENYYSMPADNVAFAQNFARANIRTEDLSAPQLSFSATGPKMSGNIQAVVPTSLMGLVGISSVPISVKATAIPVEAPLCLLSLNKSADQSIYIHGTSSFEGKNCGIQANSTSKIAIAAPSNTQSKADFVCYIGGASGNFNVQPEKCRNALDPYSGLPVPAVSGCDAQNAKTTNGTAVYYPGIYCGGISLKGGNVTFKPGLYVIEDGALDISANSVVSGQGVTFYLYGNNAVLKFAGNADTTLSAPTTGSYAGLVFVQNSTAAPGSTSSITGTDTTNIQGVGYFPTQTLSLSGSGNLGAASDYMTFVADKFEFSGTGKMVFSYNPTGNGYSSTQTAKRFVTAKLVD